MSRAWHEGDVAMVSGPEEEPVRCIYNGVNYWIGTRDSYWTEAQGAWSITDVRPLVVIDPEDVEQVNRLAEIINKHDGSGADWPADLGAALREHADPKPRIEEPTNWLSVIRDNEGIEWYRWSVRPKDRDQAWVSVWDEGRRYPTGWDDIHAVEIVSAGIELAE